MSDRALSSGISIPQWMRGTGKPLSGFDPSNLSPPTYEDGFFQSPLTKTTKGDNSTGFSQLDSLRNDSFRNTSPRPQGVDDGFNGPNSACASSVVRVAHRMLRAKPPPPSQRQRRNSKSLPASPLGSPETRRRIVNSFFTLEESSKDNQGSSSSIIEALNRERDFRAKSSAPQIQKPVQTETLKPQPSEYREMNFWSPTSM